MLIGRTEEMLMVYVLTGRQKAGTISSVLLLVDGKKIG
jgi:hypothetical protein